MISRFEIKTASPEVKARAKTFHCYERGQWVYVQTEPHKDDRGVLFKDSIVECFSAETGEQCPRNQFGGVCSHSYAAERRKRINAKRRATLAKRLQRKEQNAA